jgi:SAM-dependent methyltransferase
MIPYTGERYIPWALSAGRQIALPHIARYNWSLRFLWNKSVIDIGCGAGYGSFMISWIAKQVIGVDRSAEAIQAARDSFSAAPNLGFIAMDLESATRGALLHTADVYVAFEVLEHLNDPLRVVRDALPLVWSMPVNDASAYRVRPYTVLGIESMLPGPKWAMNPNGDIEPLSQAICPTYVLGYTEEL